MGYHVAFFFQCGQQTVDRTFSNVQCLTQFRDAKAGRPFGEHIQNAQGLGQRFHRIFVL